MRVAIIQSSYIPWKGYFDIIRDVDRFIFLDDVQFTTRDWRTRNRIKTPNGPLWLSIPAGNDRNRLIHEVKLPDSSWQKKHWSSIVHAYARAPHFMRYRALFEAIYLERAWATLSELNQHLVRTIAYDILGISTPLHDAREFNAEGQKLERILDLLTKVGATAYVSGPSADAYLQPERFADLGIALTLKDYSGYPEYPQAHPPFEHALSVLDLLFNTGHDAAWYIWGWRNGGDKA